MQQQQQRMSDDTNSSGLELPPGFRFHPSNEEIIICYLRPKVLDDRFTAHAIGEADINKSEPWELPGMAKMGEKEWYFYCLKGQKYPSGFRANRATKAGYWKATGKDREIYGATSRGAVLIGMKKTLVFYKGRAPTGAKTNWVMHEFRLDGSDMPPSSTARSSSSTITAMKSSSKEEWVVCRIYHKGSGIKKEPTSSFNIATIVGNVDQRSMSLPLRIQSPMGLENFTTDSNTMHPIMDSSMFLYSSAGVNSTLSPALSPMPGIGNSRPQMDATHFRNSIVTTQPTPLYQQMGMGPTNDGGLMAGLDSGATPIVMQDSGMSSNQTNIIDISSMVSTNLPSVATMNTIDVMWKF